MPEVAGGLEASAAPVSEAAVEAAVAPVAELFPVAALVAPVPVVKVPAVVLVAPVAEELSDAPLVAPVPPDVSDAADFAVDALLDEALVAPVAEDVLAAAALVLSASLLSSVDAEASATASVVEADEALVPLLPPPPPQAVSAAVISNAMICFPLIFIIPSLCRTQPTYYTTQRSCSAIPGGTQNSRVGSMAHPCAHTTHFYQSVSQRKALT